ncbi:MAG: PEP-CTERM sorting domain-containing protein [Aulosira sp. DedQUE10]|nr:PEP-CTERM sorting domain-containing protein [Aulosira sp. DedQUE10]
MAFKTIGLGIALTCGTFAVGSTLSPAQAAFINIVGTSNFLNGSQNSPTSDKITFSNSKVESLGGSLFSALTEGSGVNVSAVNLTNPTNIQVDGTETKAKYTGTSTNPFLTFLSDPGLSFQINNPFDVTRTRESDFTTTSAKFSFLGAFYKGGQFLSKGIVTANEVNGVPGSYSMTIKSQDVPEPFTILGSITALGMGVAMKKKQIQRLKKEKVTA